MKRVLLWIVWILFIPYFVYSSTLYLSVKKNSIPIKESRRFVKALNIEFVNCGFSVVENMDTSEYKASLSLFCRDTLSRGKGSLRVQKVIVNCALRIENKLGKQIYNNSFDLEGEEYVPSLHEAYSLAYNLFVNNYVKKDIRETCKTYLAKPIIISDVTVDTLYPSLLEGVKNNLHVTLKDYSDKDSYRTVTIEVNCEELLRKSLSVNLLIKGDTTISVTLPFDREKVKLHAGKQYVGEVSLTGKHFSNKKTVSLLVKSMNAISWAENPYSIGSFISYNEDFRAITNAIFSKINVSGVRKDFYKTIAIVEYIKQLQIPVGDDVSLDRNDLVAYPAQMLNNNQEFKKRFDCDDHTVLLATLLIHSGIDVSFIDYKEHITLAAHLNIPYSNGDFISRDKKMIININGEAVLPLECTLLSKGFLKAWSYGAQQFYNSAFTKKIYSLKKSWRMHPPHKYDLGSVEVNKAFSADLVHEILDEIRKEYNKTIEKKEYNQTVQQKGRQYFLQKKYRKCVKFLSRYGDENSIVTQHNILIGKFYNKSISENELVKKMSTLWANDTTGTIALNRLIAMKLFTTEERYNTAKEEMALFLKEHRSHKKDGVIYLPSPDDDEEDESDGKYGVIYLPTLDDDDEELHKNGVIYLPTLDEQDDEEVRKNGVIYIPALDEDEEEIRKSGGPTPLIGQLLWLDDNVPYERKIGKKIFAWTLGAGSVVTGTTIYLLHLKKRYDNRAIDIVIPAIPAGE